MRKAACGLLFATAMAFAQTPSAPNPAALDANADQAKAMVDALRSKLDHLSLVNPPGPQLLRLPSAPLVKPSVCAVPLLRVIPPGTSDKMTTVRPPVQPREYAGTVKVPAPACDARLFTNGAPITLAPAVPKP